MKEVWHSYAQLRILLDGMLIMLVLYGLLSYWQQRKAIYWQYALYIVCMMVTFRLLDGDYSKAEYLPGMNYKVVFMETFAFSFYMQFAILLMNIRENDRFSFLLLRGMIGVLVVHLFIDSILVLAGVPDAIRSEIYTIDRYLLGIGALVIVPRIIRLRHQVMVYFIVGSFFFIFACIFALSTNFLPTVFIRRPDLPFGYPVTYIELGVVAEVLCFTLGISRLNHLTELEKISVQAQLIDQLQENEKKQQKISRIRDEIACDLHDEVGSDLSAITMLSRSARKLVYDQPEQVSETLHTIGQTSKKVLSAIRDIVWSLNSSQRTYENLTFRMREMAYSLFEKTTTSLHFDFMAIAPDELIPVDQRRDIFLFYKESLHNILRHAKAGTVCIRLSLTDDKLVLEITDDGVGFNAAAQRGGNGLLFLRQRADSLGGVLEINSVAGQGTSIVLTCPVGIPA